MKRAHGKPNYERKNNIEMNLKEIGMSMTDQ
jgi:hypothetical protein